MEIKEEDILSYMSQFNIKREQAIIEIKSLMEEWQKHQGEAMQDVYEHIVRCQY